MYHGYLDCPSLVPDSYHHAMVTIVEMLAQIPTFSYDLLWLGYSGKFVGNAVESAVEGLALQWLL